MFTSGEDNYSAIILKKIILQQQNSLELVIILELFYLRYWHWVELISNQVSRDEKFHPTKFSIVITDEVAVMWEWFN